MTRWEQKNGETGQHSLSYNNLIDYDCGDKYMVAVFSEQYSDKGKDLSDLTNLGIMLTYTGITLSSDHES